MGRRHNKILQALFVVFVLGVMHLLSSYRQQQKTTLSLVKDTNVREDNPAIIYTPTKGRHLPAVESNKKADNRDPKKEPNELLSYRTTHAKQTTSKEKKGMEKVSVSTKTFSHAVLPDSAKRNEPNASSLAGSPLVPSCVIPCTERKFFPVSVPVGSKCLESTLCMIARHNLIFAKRKRAIARWYKNPGNCTSDGFINCPVPSETNCKGHCWNQWSVYVHWNETYSTGLVYYDLQIQPDRPFVITSLFQNPDNSTYVDVVSFFLPNMLHKSRCNMIYCVYESPLGVTETYPAIVGDTSYLTCHKPTTPTNKTTLRLTYDMKTYSEPRSYQVEKQDKPLENVLMMICSMVKNEGINLQEWIEFHIMMGYRRFVLYDNNPTPDLLMEKIIEKYSNYIIRHHWNFRHSQTEALTDCILRYSATAKWATFIDVDEFVVPAKKFKNMRYLLKWVLADQPYIHTNWVTFAPCPNDTASESRMMMEICRNVTSVGSSSPKATFQLKYAASMQGYGPHFIRLKRDLGVSAHSKSYNADELFRIYHYRYKTYKVFMERRVGDIAGLTESWIPKGLEQSWEKGIRNQIPFPDDMNYMLRFLPELKRRIEAKPIA